VETKIKKWIPTVAGMTGKEGSRSEELDSSLTSSAIESRWNDEQEERRANNVA